MEDATSTESNFKNHTLVGKWFDGDEGATTIVITVRASGDQFAVDVIDGYDDEVGEVHDVRWDGEVLSFAVHWTSTGRFVKHKLQALSKNRVDLVYTYTHQEMWHRLDDAEPE